ncbi:GPI transamidase subunit PIG-U-domain-containing protein [Rhodocollybia butyracea]|uniref:GPI transamidase subunit PIG-U-domain-containing protein n=1 Tax=Rhodocollybia butyracea TaxID=206335 RepID=A0A9P5PFI2_9AGAR|nr:GPI transamidase subunit PIG-U-domain-containing protein [Rhodocollybia butyracea]
MAVSEWDERFLSAALYTGVDVFAAYALVRIWTARQRKQTLSSESTESKSSLLIIIYTLNPLIILPSLARSTSSVDNAVLLTAICLACHAPVRFGALFFLALRTHLSIDALILVPPMFMLIFSSPASRLRRPGLSNFVEISLFILLWTALAAYARTCAGDWKWVWQTWGASLTLPSLTPNPGVWWYFFTEMFDHFRPFFLMVFSLHLLLYHDPLYSIFILIGILATLKPYPPYLTMVYLRHPLLLSLLFYTPLSYNRSLRTYGLRMERQCNFYYASTLVGACAGGLGIVDSIWLGYESQNEALEEKEVVTQQ